MTAESPRPTVLVVDDERGPRESLRMILAPAHRVLQAESGAEALRLLDREPVDLVTLDLHMPGMKGDELMRTIRAQHPDVEIVVITGCGSVASAAEGIRAGICDYLQKPFDVVQVTAAAARAFARGRARRRLVHFLDALGHEVGRDRDAAALLRDVHTSHKLRGRLGDLFDRAAGPVDPAAAGAKPTVEFLEVLAETIETKDRFMRGHARRVADHVGLLAERVGISGVELEHLRIAAFLHDLGKVGVPTDLLLRPGALDGNERAVVEEHPAIGARLLGPLDLPAGIVAAVRHHHEWWDGTGYPDGLAGEEIPRAARVIAVADAFDAMSSDRPYRGALPRATVLGELRRYAGVQFDPELAHAFAELVESGECDTDAAPAAAESTYALPEPALAGSGTL